MKTSDLKPGIWYEVCLARVQGSFECGDLIRLESNGDVTCRQAEGWIQAEHAAEELAKVEARPHVKDLRQEAELLKKRLAEIEEVMK